MTRLSSDQIAEKFSKCQPCEFWLSRKQVNWLIGQFDRENGYPPSHFGRRQAKGQFRNNNNLFAWEAAEGYHGPGLFKVRVVEEEQPLVDVNHPVYRYLVSQGRSWDEFANAGPDEMFQIINESIAWRKNQSIQEKRK